MNYFTYAYIASTIISIAGILVIVKEGDKTWGQTVPALVLCCVPLCNILLAIVLILGHTFAFVMRYLQSTKWWDRPVFKSDHSD